jgi:3-oxoadipate enol-lactonase
MQTTRLNGIDICYDVQGEGPWVVLSHSLACDRTMWDEQMAVLTRSYRVLRFDTRGHGRSGAPPGPYTLDLLADDLKALLDHLSISRAHFVGLSMGGMIGQTFALKYPGIFQTLVLCDTTSAYPAATAAIWDERIRTAREQGMAALVDSTLARWFSESFRRRRPKVMKRFGALISSTPVEGYIGCSQALVRIDVTERLKTLNLPALVVVGEHDPGTPVAMARAIHQSLPRSELAILPDAAHISNVEQSDRFTQLLLEFLRRH